VSLEVTADPLWNLRGEQEIVMATQTSLYNAFFVSTLASVAFMIVYPVMLGALAHQRPGVSWRYILYGAAIFFVFQGPTRIPAVQLIQTHRPSRGYRA
jgi:hypothetical protein